MFFKEYRPRYHVFIVLFVTRMIKVECVGSLITWLILFPMAVLFVLFSKISSVFCLNCSSRKGARINLLEMSGGKSIVCQNIRSHKIAQLMPDASHVFVS